MITLKTKIYFKNIFKSTYLRAYSSKFLWKVTFFGSNQFSLHTLKLLHSYYIKGALLRKLDVVTNVTQSSNAIQKYAEKHKLQLYNWPDIHSECYDVGIVVSFGHLIPNTIISKFTHGILNIHASILPRWRGAAPIIYAIANGDAETGVTIMRIKPDKFDTGDILLQKKVIISNEIEMPDLHKTLGILGADCLIETLHNLPIYLMESKPQSNENVTYAPKVTPDFATVKWREMSSVQVYNLHRALKDFMSPMTTWQGTSVKLSGIEIGDINDSDVRKMCGFVKYDKTINRLKVLCADKRFVHIEHVHVHRKKKMSAADFYNGFISKVPIYLSYFK